MKKTFLAIGMIVMLAIAVLVLTGCGEKEEEAKGIVGSWSYSPYGTEYTYTFNSDKTGSYSVSGTAMPFTYEDQGDKVTILYNGNTVPSTFAYRIEGNKLIIKDSFGTDVEYTKK